MLQILHVCVLSLSSIQVLMLLLHMVQGNKLEITSGSVITVIFAIIFNGVELNVFEKTLHKPTKPLDTGNL